MALLSNTGIRAGASAAGGGGYQIEKSLRFDGGDSSYLNRTPSSAGDRRKWTWSGWVKRSELGSRQYVFTAGLSTGSTESTYFRVGFESTDKFWVGSYNYNFRYTDMLFRDPSAWYHIVVTFDTTNATAADRCIIYVNGVRQSTTGDADPVSSAEYAVNAAVLHKVSGDSYYLDGYLTDVHLIDGQALDPSSFGETNEDTGQWVAKEYTGTYGPTVDQSEVWSDDVSGTSNSGVYTGLFDGTVTGYEMGADNQTLTYTPDGGISASSSIKIYLGQSSGTYAGSADITVNGSSVKTAIGTAMGTGSVEGWFDIGTTSLTTLTWSNPSGGNNDYRLMAIAVDGKMLVDTGVTVNDNSFYLKYTGTDLGEDSSGNNNDWTANNLTAASTNFDVPCVSFDGTDDYLELADSTDFDFGTSDFTLECFVNPDSPGSDGYQSLVMKADSGTTYAGSSWWWALYSYAAGTSLSYCYIYNGSTYKVLQGSSLPNGRWHHIAVVRDGDTARLYHNGVQVDSISVSGWTQNSCSNTVRIGSDGGANYDMDGAISNVRIVNGTCLYPDGTTFTVPSRPLANVTNTKLLCCQSSSTTADDNSDSDHTITASGNAAAGTKSDDTSDDDVSTDTPTSFDDGGNGTGNYCTMNPLQNPGPGWVVDSFSQGNLKVVTNSTYYGVHTSTFATPLSGKWYAEVKLSGTVNYTLIGLVDATSAFTTTNTWDTLNGVAYYASNGNKYVDTSATSYGSAYDGTSVSYVIGIAYDADNQTVNFYKDGTDQGTITGVPLRHYFFGASDWDSSNGVTYTWNFGARSFAHTPPTGYKALNTYNLPDPTIADPSKYFDTKLYTGTGASHAITGLNFSPDLVWIKKYTAASHAVFDTIRGATYRLKTDSTAEVDWDNTTLTAFGTEGFTLSTKDDVNQNTDSYVSWNWDAGTANKVNTEIDQSQDWSSTSNLGGSTTEAAKAFLGYNFLSGTGTVAYDNTGNNVLTTAPLSGVTKLEIMCNRTHSGATDGTKITIDGTAYYDKALAANGWSEVDLGGATISNTSGDSIYIKDEGGSASALWGVRVNGKVLVDSGNSLASVPSIYAGGLNSTIYDQSDTWSSDGSNAVAGNPWTNGFDGDDSNTVYADHNETATWTPDGTITGITSLEVKGYAYQAGGTYSKFKINGTDYTSTFGSDYTVWKTITGITTLTSISVGQEDGTHATGFVAVRINGKELIDTGVSVTDFPTIASTYRANPDAGFSIVSYTGNGVTGATVAHGLGAKPDLVILKSRNYQYNWTVYHKSLGNTHGIYLNLTNAKEDNATFWDDTDPTSTVITFGNDGNTNVNGSDIVAYCWSEVAGYSKFGSYTGNDVGDGVFVHCGFKPAFVMIKNTTTASTEWIIVDNARDTDNVVQHILNPNDTTADDTSADLLDFVSNGFKLRSGTSRANEGSSNIMIYAAFAETPLKYSNAR